MTTMTASAAQHTVHPRPRGGRARLGWFLALLGLACSRERSAPSDPNATAAEDCAAAVRQARTEEALVSCTLALRLARAAADPSATCLSGQRLAHTYWSKEDHRRALLTADTALQACAVLPARHSQVLLLLISILHDIGDLNAAQAALDLAETASKNPDAKADPTQLRFFSGLLRQGRGENDAAAAAYRLLIRDAPPGHESLRWARLNLLEIYLLQGQVELARQALVLAYREPGENKVSVSQLITQHYYTAEIAQIAGHPAAAIAALNSALLLQPKQDWRRLIYTSLGRSKVAKGDTAGAISAFQQAIEAVEEVRRDIGNSELRYWTLAAHRTPYEELFRLHALAGHPVRALAIVEQARARVFLDSFVSSRRSTPTAGVAAPLDLKNAARRASLLQRLLPQLRASALAQPPPIAAVLQRLRGQAGLGYFVANGELWAIALGGEQPRIERLATELRRLTRLVDDFIATPDSAAVRRALGQLLLPSHLLPPAKVPLVIIGDPILSDVSFAALLMQDRALIQRHTIRYSPSLSAWSAGPPAAVASGSHTNGTSDLTLPPKNVVLGDPLGNLPGARAEAQAVAVSLGTTAKLGSAATTLELRRAAGADILHIASHSGIDTAGPWLQLAGGRINASSVLEWRVNPGLVVLASCTSAAQRARGLFGSLAGAFLAAGSRSVVASLWSVDDAAASRFSQRFYKNGGAVQPSTALAKTQRQAIAAGEPVGVWSSFVLYGTPPPRGADAP